eukprot:294707-Pyramimonas_sp.AAC.1
MFHGADAVTGDMGAFSAGQIANPLRKPRGRGRQGNPTSRGGAEANRWNNPAGLELIAAALRLEVQRCRELLRLIPGVRRSL